MLVNALIRNSGTFTTFACDGKACSEELTFQTMYAAKRGPIPVVGEVLPGWLRASLKRRKWSSSTTTGKTFCPEHTIVPVYEEIEILLSPAKQRKANLAAAKERADRRREKDRLRQKEYQARKAIKEQKQANK